jgi:pimeloyl-ACP methyl ester carboxylesterase
MNEAVAMFKSRQLEQNYMEAYDNTLSLWPVPYQSLYINTQHGNTHVVVSGPAAGEPVVLLNGFGFSSTMWYPNIEALSSRYRVYAVDVIGEFNRSVTKSHFREKQDYVNWLTALLDQCNIDQASFIGHSNGGWHALNFAIHAQHRVTKIALLAPAASFTPFAKQFGLRLLAANLIRTRSAIIDFCAKWFVNKVNHAMVSDSLFEQFYHGIIGFGWKHKILIPSVFSDEDLKLIKVPALLAIGDKEVIYKPKRVFARAQQLIPHIQLSSIQGAGHALSLEKSAYVNNLLLDFLHS